MFLLQMNKRFTKEEKEACLPIIYKFLMFAELVRKKGYLSLELEIPEEQNVFLKRALELLLDPIEPTLLEKILQNLIVAENCSGSQLFEKALIMEGTLALQHGLNPRQVFILLLSMMGEEYLARIDELKPDNTNNPYADLINAFKGKKASLESIEFEKKLMGFSDRAIQIIISKKQRLAHALYGCSIEFICRILDNVSRNQCMYLCEQLLQIEPFSPKHSLEASVKWAQNDIIETIIALEKSGSIVGPH